MTAKPRTTFGKKLSILKGEVFFIDKDLLMGADHEEASQIDSRCNAIIKKLSYCNGIGYCRAMVILKIDPVQNITH